MHALKLSREAESTYRWLARRDAALFERIRNALLAIQKTPHEGKRLKLQLAGRWSWRVGSYRIIYRIVDAGLLVLVLDIGNRRDVYR